MQSQFPPNATVVHRLPRPHLLSAAIVLAMLPAAAWGASDVEFNPQFLQGGAGKLDLKRFERGEHLPGTYSADIRVNGIIVARREIELRSMPDSTTAICLTPKLIDVFGVDQSRLPVTGDAGASDADGHAVSVRPLPREPFCEELGHFIPQATATFDSGEQVLDVSIPQAYLSRNPRGWVSPDQWDDGINAARLGYSISHQRMTSRGTSREYTSATLNSGLNLGDWRFRHDGFLSQTGGSPAKYRSGRTYAQRALPSQGMELTLGESSTTGDLFEGVNFRGVNIATDPRMLPDSQRDYAPIVRGVAQTNAQIIIRQRDYVLYQTNVAAGPFEINDLYGTAYAGDLDVEVVESDGRVQRFSVPFAAVPQLLRAGQTRSSVTAGVLNDSWVRTTPALVEATVRRGMSNRLTAFGGVTGSEGYNAVVLGGALNTRIGAFSGDVTHSNTDLPGQVEGFGRRMQGQSFRLTYSKDIAATDTSIAMAAYRYSTDGYLTLNEAARLRQDLGDGLDGQTVARQRSRLDLTVNQRLGERGGALYASGSSMNYWNLRQRRTNYSVGYSNTAGLLSYSVSAQRSLERNLFGGSEARQTNSINFNLSMPLGVAPSAPRFNGSMARASDGGNDLRAGVTGSFGQDRQGSYSASASRNGSRSTAFNGSVGYQSPVATLSAGYSHSTNSRGVSLGANGGVVLHGDGLVFTQQMGDTVGVIEVPNAAGAGIGNAVGVKTNSKGFAVVPYLQPYRRNEVTVDPKGLSLDVELKTAGAIAVPTAGAVVKLLVPTDSGRSALIQALQDNGQPLPFGMDVYNEVGEVVGVVGQASRLWVRGIEERGLLTVRLDEARQCEISFDVAGAAAGEMMTGQCRITARSAE